MQLTDINVLAVIAAALSSFVLGGVWYSPLLFAAPWMKANGFTDESLRQASMARIFGFSLALDLVICTNLAMFLGTSSDLAWGAAAGALAGGGWVAASLGVTYLFERKPLALWLINGGYHLVGYTLKGMIIGAWH